jgi:branched chain amino acid efflux pump
LLNSQTVWLTIVAMGTITFALRLSFIAFLGRVKLPASVRRGLDFVPPAVFAGLIFPDLLRNTMTAPLSLPMEARLIAGIAAVIIAWRTKNVLLTIGVGFAVLFLLQALT